MRADPKTSKLADWLLERGRTLPEMAYLHAQMLLDTSYEDTQINEIAKTVLGPIWVDGDSYGVPGNLEIVEKLVDEIKKLRAAPAS